MYKYMRFHLISILSLAMALLCQGCIGSTFKDDPDNMFDKEFGNLSSVPDLPPTPDFLKYQQARQELSSVH